MPFCLFLKANLVLFFLQDGKRICRHTNVQEEIRKFNLAWVVYQAGKLKEICYRLFLRFEGNSTCFWDGNTKITFAKLFLPLFIFLLGSHHAHLAPPLKNSPKSHFIHKALQNNFCRAKALTIFRWQS